MWRTQAGERILRGAEARLIRSAFAVLVDQVEEEIEGLRESLEIGIPIFDRLQARQKLALLSDVGHHLLCSTGPPPPLTATNESAVAALDKVIEDWVTMEVDDEASTRGMPGEEPFAWRRSVLAAFSEMGTEDFELPAESCRDIDEWSLLIECLETRVLWDADFLEEDAPELHRA